MDDNNNVNIYGGNLSGNSFAVGAGASIHNTNNPDIAQLSALLDQLLSRISQSQEAIPNKTEVISTLATLKQELAGGKPDHEKVKGMFSSIMENLKYVKDLAPLAAGLWHHIGPLIGIH